MGEFTITVPQTFIFSEGWGVWIEPVWNTDEETGQEWISCVDSGIVRIKESVVSIIGGEPCVAISDNFYYPVANFAAEVVDCNSDTHDLRARFFETEADAKDHLTYTLDRWNNPQPWESFIKF